MAYNPIVIGGGTEATAQRVTIATDSTGVLSIDDNGAAITVDGTVTANLAAGTNNIGDVDILSIAAGDNNIGNVDVASSALPTGASTLAEQQSQTTHLATIAGDTTAIETAVQIIDNAIHVDDAAFTLGTHSGVMMMGFAGTQSVNANDAGAIAMETDGAVHIHDGGNTITVDGTVAVTGVSTAANQTTIIGHVDGIETLLSTIDADTGGILTATQLIDNAVATIGTTDLFRVAIFDNANTQITSFGGGTEYTEDVATANPIVGKAIMVERDDALSAVTPIEGDNIGLRGTAEGALWTQDFNSDAILADTTAIKTAVEIIDNAISGNEMQVDVLTMPTVTVNAHAVTNAGTFVVQENGAALTALQLIDDAVQVLGTDTYTETSSKGITLGAVRRDADTTLVNTTNEFTPLQVDANGRLKVEVFSGEALPVTFTGSTDVATQTTLASALTALQIMDDWDNAASDGASVSGDVAHDTGDAGEPVKIGMKAYELDGTAPQTAVAEADRVNAIGDLVGRQYVATEHPRFWHVSADYASAQTNTSVQASPGAGLALYITDIMISNGATAGNITLLNGSGGTVLFEIYPAINGGVSMNLKNPIKLSDATALCITSTSVTTHSVFVSGFID